MNGEINQAFRKMNLPRKNQCGKSRLMTVKHRTSGIMSSHTELKKTSGQRSISVQISIMATQITVHSVIMSRQSFEKCMI